MVRCERCRQAPAWVALLVVAVYVTRWDSSLLVRGRGRGIRGLRVRGLSFAGALLLGLGVIVASSSLEVGVGLGRGG